MLYRVFNNQAELDQANANWMQARANAGVHDCKLGAPVDPETTARWSTGKEMLDGRLACPVPDNWADSFGGLELELTDEDFPTVESEV